MSLSQSWSPGCEMAACGGCDRELEGPRSGVTRLRDGTPEAPGPHDIGREGIAQNMTITIQHRTDLASPKSCCILGAYGGCHFGCGVSHFDLDLFFGVWIGDGQAIVAMGIEVAQRYGEKFEVMVSVKGFDILRIVGGQGQIGLLSGHCLLKDFASAPQLGAGEGLGFELEGDLEDLGPEAQGDSLNCDFFDLSDGVELDSIGGVCDFLDSGDGRDSHDVRLDFDSNGSGKGEQEFVPRVPLAKTGDGIDSLEVRGSFAAPSLHSGQVWTSLEALVVAGVLEVALAPTAQEGVGIGFWGDSLDSDLIESLAGCDCLGEVLNFDPSDGFDCLDLGDRGEVGTDKADLALSVTATGGLREGSVAGGNDDNVVNVLVQPRHEGDAGSVLATSAREFGFGHGVGTG